MRLDPDGQLPRDLDAKVDLTGVAGNFWLGLALLHTLFTREHNAICDRLAAEHSDWTDDELFAQARLINGGADGEDPHRRVDAGDHRAPDDEARHARELVRASSASGSASRKARSEVLGGIPGSATNHHGVPYSLTEEFVAVYRMHPLLPDDFTFRSIATDEVVQERTFRELGVARRARPARRGRLRGRVLLVRDRAPGRDHAAQLPALPAGAARAGRHRASTSRRSTCSGSASAACPATTSSGGSST